jgi:hypothetical protein
MRPLRVVIADELGHDGRQMLLIQHDDVVQTFAPECADDSLNRPGIKVDAAGEVGRRTWRRLLSGASKWQAHLGSNSLPASI